MNIPETVKEILSALNGAGFEAYAVGGCVRDSILGRIPEDWDITTNAEPQAVKRLFRRTIDTGIEHGTVTVMRGKEGYEITTYRLDGTYSDGRHPDSVVFTPELREDLKRRDFTINAMACSADGEIVDLFGGREDLQRGVIRCVGEPDERFTEDALRILRALRFSAQLNFQIEENTWEALRNHAPNLSRVSRERIFAELNKTLLSEHPERLELIFDAGLALYLAERFPALCCECTVAVLPKEKYLRWAAVCRKLPAAEVKHFLREMKSDLTTLERTVLLVERQRERLPQTKEETRILLSEIGPERFDDLLLLKRMDCAERETSGEEELYRTEKQVEQEETCGIERQCEAKTLHRTEELPARALLQDVARAAEMKREIMEAGDCISLKTLAVGGRDLLQLGVKPGPEVGRKLNRLFCEVLKNPALNQRETLLKLLEIPENSNAASVQEKKRMFPE